MRGRRDSDLTMPGNGIETRRLTLFAQDKTQKTSPLTTMAVTSAHDRLDPLAFQAWLADENGYRPFPKRAAAGIATSELVRSLHGADARPQAEAIAREEQPTLRDSATGVAIARLLPGHFRLVVGDYGCFIEFDESCLACDTECAPGQAWRTQERWRKRVKYLWLQPRGGVAKLYHQTRGVTYADYRPGMYYVSPFQTTL